jgi:hypothetical protein
LSLSIEQGIADIVGDPTPRGLGFASQPGDAQRVPAAPAGRIEAVRHVPALSGAELASGGVSNLA